MSQTSFFKFFLPPYYSSSVDVIILLYESHCRFTLIFNNSQRQCKIHSVKIEKQKMCENKIKNLEFLKKLNFLGQERPKLLFQLIFILYSYFQWLVEQDDHIHTRRVIWWQEKFKQFSNTISEGFISSKINLDLETHTYRLSFRGVQIYFLHWVLVQIRMNSDLYIRYSIFSISSVVILKHIFCQIRHIMRIRMR